MRTEYRGTDTARRQGATATEPEGRGLTARSRAGFGPTLALTMTLALAAYTVVLALVMLAIEPTPIPDFDLVQTQRAESLLYGAAFVIVALALVVGPLLADRIAARSGPGAGSLTIACLAGALAASVLVARVLPDGGVVEALAVIGVWWIGAIVLLERSARGRLPGRLAGTERVPYAWGAAGALTLAALLAFTTVASISVLPLAIGVVAVPAAVLWYARRPAGTPGAAPSAWPGRAVDGGVILLLLWLVPNLVIFSAGPLGSFNPSVAQFHHDLWLGPVNEMLAGRPLLVDTAAQYGIAPIYLLAGWFQLAPIGYGTLGFLDGLLYVLLLCGGYVVLRIAGVSRLLAAGTLAFAVVVVIYNLEFPVGFLPQHGPLRFGLPMALILAATAGARWPRHEGWAWGVQLAVVGLSSIWSLEAFAYTAFTFAAIVAFQAWMRTRARRVTWLARRAGVALLACVVANLLFVSATLAFTGELPDYGWYLGFLEAFLLGNLSEITYDLTPWSGGIALGAGYAASAAALVLLIRRRRDLVEREWPTVIAACGTTAYGIALFTYFVDRSPDHVLPYVAFPLVLVGALWLSLLLRPGMVGSRSVRLGGLALALSLVVLLVSVAWSSIGDRFEQSPLGHVVPGGDSLGEGLEGLWEPPPLDPSAPRGEELLARYMPEEDRVVIVTSPDLATEILIRSGRSNRLAFSYPLEDSFVRSRLIPALGRSVDELRPGERMLLQAAGLKAFRELQRRPDRDVLNDPVADSGLIPEQQLALQEIGRRFDAGVIHRDESGFVVVALEPRRGEPT
jgi:hypothetical protein